MNVPAFKSIRKAGVPLCAIETADPAQTMAACRKLLKPEVPVVSWDIIRGLEGINQRGTEFVSKHCPNGGAVDAGNPSEALRILAKMGKDDADTVIFWHNAHRFIPSVDVAQGIWNLRDQLKFLHGTLVLLGPGITLPSELKHDVVVLSEPLPGTEELSKILDSTVKDAQLTIEIKQDQRAIIIDILRGLSSFAAEQVIAMSTTKAGVDLDGLWERKRKMIEQTPGLSVWKGGETLGQLGGLDNLKTFLTSVLTSGNTPVRAIGFIDEIEKGFAGAGGETSGTSADQLQVFLKVMQDLDIPGIILVGPPGTGKSSIAKAAGSIAQAPVIAIDTGAMKASLVGESEQRIRTAMEVFKAVSQGKGLFIATCNKIAALPPELRRRFTLGTFFVDLPDAQERNIIWDVWLKRYGIRPDYQNGEDLPKTEGWSGAEIRACCDVAFRTGLKLKQAATYIVPVIKSAPDQVEALRTLANGRFISANHAGIYEYKKEQLTTSGRKMELED